MATHSFSSPHTLDFNMLVIFSLKNVKQGHKGPANIFICLLDHAYVVLLAKYQNGTPKVARKADNMGEVWNPV